MKIENCVFLGEFECIFAKNSDNNPIIFIYESYRSSEIPIGISGIGLEIKPYLTTININLDTEKY